jgi:hypothetical protein
LSRLKAGALLLVALSTAAVLLSAGGAVAQRWADRAYSALAGRNSATARGGTDSAAPVAGTDSAASVAAEVETGAAPVLRPVRLSYARPASIPALVYHEIDNGCTPVAAQCNATDVEASSERQVADEFAYLYSHGYRTITGAQYVAWAKHERVALPAKPILLTDDNGIGNFLEYAQPLLQRYGFTLVAFIVTGFADGAAGNCAPAVHVDDQGKPGVISLQPGCPQADENWDLTWPQLRALGPAYSFGLEAGSSGHYVQSYDHACQVFYACKLPGETTAAYEKRVRSEQAKGLAELDANLPGRVNNAMWVVPYGDLGYKRCPQQSCTPQPSDGPKGWLVRYAAARYPVVFVEDAFRNGVEHEHFRFDVQGWMTATYFEHTLTADIAHGEFRG